MKIKFIIFSLIFSALSVSFNAFSQDPAEIVTKAKQKVQDLTSIKMKGKIVTGAIDITYTEGVIDYAKYAFVSMDKKNSKITNSVYFKDDIAYMYNGIAKSWFKFDKSIDMWSFTFDRSRWFIFFPDNAIDFGFKVSFVGEEEVDGKQCYTLSSKVSDELLAREFLFKRRNEIFPESIASNLSKDNSSFVDFFLDTYLRDFEYILWVSKDNFFVKKILRQNRQATGPQESVIVKNEIIYFAFNLPVEVNIPKAAKDATLISAQDIDFED